MCVRVRAPSSCAASSPPFQQPTLPARTCVPRAVSLMIPAAVMATYCLSMVALLACYHDYIRAFLGVLRRGKSLVHSPQRRVFARAAGIVGLACIGGGVLTVIILGLTVAASSEHFDSFSSPTLFYM